MTGDDLIRAVNRWIDLIVGNHTSTTLDGHKRAIADAVVGRSLVTLADYCGLVFLDSRRQFYGQEMQNAPVGSLTGVREGEFPAIGLSWESSYDARCWLRITVQSNGLGALSAQVLESRFEP